MPFSAIIPEYHKNSKDTTNSSLAQLLQSDNHRGTVRYRKRIFSRHHMYMFSPHIFYLPLGVSSASTSTDYFFFKTPKDNLTLSLPLLHFL